MTTVTSSNSSGGTYISGTVSGLDTSTLVANAVSEREKEATSLEDKITVNENKISAYSDLQDKAQALLDTMNKLQSNTVGSSTTNLFSAKEVSYAASDNSTGSNIAEVTTGNGAAAGTHTIVVTQIAKALSVTSSEQASASAALGYSGSFTIGEDGKTASTISIGSTDSLSSIVAAINNTTSTSGVKADLLTLSDGSYKLVLSSSDTGKNFSIGGVSGDDVMTNLGITSSNGGSFSNISQQAQSAIFTLDGTQITSSSNKLTNILTGITINLVNAAPSTTVTIKLTNNTDDIKTALQDMVSEYNDLRDALDSYQKINSDGTAASGAYLAGDSITRLFAQKVIAIITASYGTGSMKGIGSLGITLNEDNHLEIDDDTLGNALTNNFEDIKSIFQEQGTSKGLADELYDVLNQYSNKTSGSFKSQSDTLDDLDTSYQSKINDIKDYAEGTYKDYLINKYAKMETSLQSAKNLQATLKALLNSSTSSDN